MQCTKVGSLADLVERYPALRDVIRHYSNLNYVPVVMNTCTLPQRRDRSVRNDCVVFGLFYVDRAEAAKQQSDKVIRQDYFVVWTDGSDGDALLLWREAIVAEDGSSYPLARH